MDISEYNRFSYLLYEHFLFINKNRDNEPKLIKYKKGRQLMKIEITII